MPLIPTYSSLPAMLRTVIINAFDMRIPMTLSMVDELAFDIISSGRIHIPSLALRFAVLKFSVVNASISIFKDADSKEHIICSLAYTDYSIGSCLAAEATHISRILELSFEANTVIDQHFTESVKIVVLFHASEFYADSRAYLTTVIPFILFFKTHSIVLCCHGLLCCS